MDEFGGDDLDAALCEFDMDGFVEQALTQPDAGAPGPIQPLLSQPLSQQQPRPCVPVGCNVPPPAAAWVAPPPAAAGVCPVLQPQPATPSQPEPGAPAAGGPPAASVDDAQRLALEATLRACFGFGSFRDKQLEVIAAVTFGRRDVACFWATGAGKSLVYQLPALHTSRTAIVVSPLISLMSDQVRKMNATVGASRGRDLACFLGSAQADSSVEQRAFAGEYAVVYVTPEKLTVGSTIERLKQLNARSGLCLVAIDEAHCVSEWGHSFREDYRKLGVIRDALPDVPVIALTATATERVQTDVLSSLRLRAPLRSLTSADRPNLLVNMMRRPDFSGAIAHLVALAAKHAGGTGAAPGGGAAGGGAAAAMGARAGAAADIGGGSMIVYCSTTRTADEVAAALRLQLEGAHHQIAAAASRSAHASGNGRYGGGGGGGGGAGGGAPRVVVYHGKMTPSARELAHGQFLTGAAPIVVATSAFGMGIDKADIRCVVNFEAPKTVEEYWQMIGRAGRDGLWANTLLLWAPSDFSRYESDFYTNGMSDQALAAVRASTARLRAIAEDERACRRAALLSFFGESAPPFGQRCGTCDTCAERARRRAARRAAAAARGGLGAGAAAGGSAAGSANGAAAACGAGGARAANDDDDDDVPELYDATDEAWLVCAAIAAAGRKPLAWTNIVKHGLSKTPPAPAVARARAALGRHCSDAHLKELLPALAAAGLVVRGSAKGSYAAYDVYSLTHAGQALAGRTAASGGAGGRRVLIQKPRAVIEAEAAAIAKRDKLVAELRSYGVDLSSIPAEQIEAQKGPALTAQLEWSRRLSNMRANGKADRADRLEALLCKVLAWRAAAAVELGIPPGSVLADYLAKNIAARHVPSGSLARYALPTTVHALTELGVRVKGVEQLAALLAQEAAAQANSTQPAAGEDAGAGAGADAGAGEGQWRKKRGLPWRTFALPSGRFKAAVPWVLGAKKSTVWENYYGLFAQGVPIEVIATRGDFTKGRAVQKTTVIQHLITALLLGRPVDLKAVVEAAGGAGRVLPNKAEWEAIDEAAALLSFAPLRDEPVPSKELVAKVLNFASVEAMPAYNTPGYETVAPMYEKIRWWTALTCAGVPQQWSS